MVLLVIIKEDKKKNSAYTYIVLKSNKIVHYSWIA